MSIWRKLFKKLVFLSVGVALFCQITSFKFRELNKKEASSENNTKLMVELLDTDKSIKWVSLDEAIDRARRDNKKVLIFVYTDWCGYCKLMEKKSFRNPDVVEYMNQKYVAVKLNAWSKGVVWFAGHQFKFIEELNIHQLAYQLLDGKMEYPTSVILNYNNYEILSPVRGYMEPRSLMKVLKFYGDDIYLTKTWNEYR